MANLPQNTTYGDNNPGVVSALREARAKYPTLSIPVRTPTTEATYSENYSNFSKGAANIPTGEAFLPAKTPHSPIPKDYGEFDKNWDTPSEGARLLSIGGGQIVSDPTQPGSFIKTVRPDMDSPTYDPQGRSRLLGDRSSSFYQIDHIVPLWAGGADTDSNKQTLSWAEHDKKTRAQAVALTLLANKKISQKEALLLAVSWKDRDVSEIPPVNEKSGMLDVKQAEDTYNLWKKQEKEGKPVTFKDFLAAIPEATKKVGDNLVPDFLPGHKYLEAGIQGLASVLSFGWIPGVSEKGNIGEQGAGIVGNIIGMAVPIGWATKILGGGAKAMTAANKVKEIGSTAGLFKVFPNTSRIAGAVPPAFMKEAILKNAGRMTAAAVAYGQLSPEGFAGVLAGDERAEPWKRLAEDTIYGVITGTIKPTTVGSLKVAGLAAATSLMFDPDHPQDALVNGLLMGGFHLAAGRVGIPREADALTSKAYRDAERAFKMQSDAVDHNAAGALKYFVGEKEINILRDPETGDLLPQGHPVYSSEAGNIERITQKALAKIDEMESNTGFPSQETAEMRRGVLQSSRLLYERGLTPENRAYAQAEDFVSTAAAVKRLEEVDAKIGESPAAIEAGKSMDKNLLTASFRSQDSFPQSGENITGTHRLTGMSSDVNSRNNKNVVDFLDTLNGKGEDGWKASPTLIVVDRSETSPFWEKQSEIIKKEIAEGIENSNRNQTPYQNPQNALEVYGVKYNEATGERVTIPLAWIARRSRIENPTYPHAFNTDAKKWKMDLLDPNINKDTLAEAMRQRGLKTLFVNIDRSKSSKEAVHSKEPYILVTINDANWNASLEYAKAARGVQKAEGMQSLVHQTKHGIDIKERREAVAEIKERVKDPVDVVLAKAGEMGDDKVYQEATISFLGEVRKTIDSSNTAPEMKSNFEKLGVYLTDEEAFKMASDKENLTVKDVTDIIFKTARKENRVSRDVDAAYRNFILPFFTSPSFNAWGLRKAFPNLKFLGGLPAAKPPKQSMFAPPVKTPQEIMKEVTPVAQQESLPTQGWLTEDAAILPQAEGAPQVSPLAAKISAEHGRILPIEESHITPTTIQVRPNITKPTSETSVKLQPTMGENVPIGVEMFGGDLRENEKKTLSEFLSIFKNPEVAAKNGVWGPFQKGTIGQGGRRRTEEQAAYGKLLDEGRDTDKIEDFYADRIASEISTGRKAGYSDEDIAYYITRNYLYGGKAFLEGRGPAPKELKTFQSLGSNPKKVPVKEVPSTGREPGVNIRWKAPSAEVTPRVTSKSPQQEAVDSAMEDMTTRIFDKIDNMVVPDTAEAYASRIGTVLKTIMPGGKMVDAKGRPRAFTNQEIAAMKGSIMSRYYPEFESRVTRSFDPIEEIMFTTKSLPQDETLKDAMVSLVHAKAAKAMGNIDRYNEIVMGMDEKVKNEAVKYFSNNDKVAGDTMFRPILPKEKPKTADPLFPSPEEGVNYSQKELADMEKTRRERGASLGKIREEEGKTFIRNIEEAKTADPSSDTFARGFAMDEMFKSFFGENYKDDKKVVRDIGEAFSGRGFSAKSAWKNLYDTTDRSGTFKEFTQPKEYLEALAEGSEPKKARAEARRKMELNAIKDAGELNDSLPEGIADEVKANNMRVSLNAQSGDSALPVTYGESKGMLYPSAGYVDDPTTVHGIADARSVVQQFMARYNDMVAAAHKRGDTSKKYLNLGKKTSTKRWDDMNEKQKAYAIKEIKAGTDKKIEEIRKKIDRIIEYGTKQKETSN